MKRTNKVIQQTIFLVIICIWTMSCYAQSKNIQQTKSVVLIYVDSFPTFKEGGNGIQNFLKKHLKWPETELDVHGTVLTSFTVLINPLFKLKNAFLRSLTMKPLEL